MPTASLPSAGPLGGLLYRSVSNVSRRQFEHSGAVEQFAAFNASAGLSGHLHLEDGNFYQYIEGDPDEVGKLMDRIARDPRHSAVTILFDAEVPQRRFADWAMSYTNNEKRSLFAWASASGISMRRDSSPRVIVDFLQASAAGA